MIFNRALPLFVVLFLVSTNAFSSVLDPEPSDSASWEFGIQTGIASPIGNKHITVQAFNGVFLNSDPDTPGEDEFAENHYPSPDFTAVSTVDGNVQPAAYLGGHLYYRFLPAVAIGLEGSANFERSVQIKSAGAFNTPLYAVDYRELGGQLVPALRLGGWIGPIRPYIMGGIGPYYVHRFVTATLLDTADDPTPARILLAGHSEDLFLSSIFGGGIDVNFFGLGSIGIALQYQRVFMPINNLQFVVPNIRFDTYF